MLSKLLSVLLTLFGVFLTIGGIVAIVKSEPNAPLYYAMLFALVAFGLACLVAAYGVYGVRRYGFILCIFLGALAAVFALFVSESIGQGLLWPVFAFMVASGSLGLLWLNKRSNLGQSHG